MWCDAVHDPGRGSSSFALPLLGTRRCRRRNADRKSQSIRASAFDRFLSLTRWFCVPICQAIRRSKNCSSVSVMFALLRTGIKICRSKNSSRNYNRNATRAAIRYFRSCSYCRMRPNLFHRSTACGSSRSNPKSVIHCLIYPSFSESATAGTSDISSTVRTSSIAQQSKGWWDIFEGCWKESPQIVNSSFRFCHYSRNLSDISYSLIGMLRPRNIRKTTAYISSSRNRSSEVLTG